MSKFECPVVRVKIEAHPDADLLEIAVVGGYRCVVRKGLFCQNSLAVYVPEQSVLPEWLLKLMGFWDELNSKGVLTGSKGNRVKAIKLRGVLSQGILLNFAMQDGVRQLPVCGEHPELGVDFDRIAFPFVAEGDDFAEYLGIVKYEPPVPVHMAGTTAGGDLDATIGYDFENIKKFPTLFELGESVFITEKIHGTLLQVGLIPESIWAGKKWADKLETMLVGVNNKPFKMMVTSKGMGKQGLMLDTSEMHNLYVGAAKKFELWAKLGRMHSEFEALDDQPIFMFGEIFGKGVQDLGYAQDAPTFQAFDIYVGTRSDGKFIDVDTMVDACVDYGVPMVPYLYVGPYSPEIVATMTNGDTTVTDANGFPIKQMREGVVIKALDNGRHPTYGRKIAKSVSEKYLMRKNATEFN